MSKHYFGLWSLLLTALVIFVVVAYIDVPTVFGYEYKTMTFDEALFSERITEAPVEMTEEIQLPIDTIPFEVEIDEPVKVDTTAQIILFVGDSMLEGLGPRLAAYANENGHTMYTVIWYSSTSEVWGKSDKLKNYISKLKPTFVVVCLGANELFVKDIATKRDKYVKKIIEDIDSIPYLWIGPPNWKPDTGINDLIEKNAAKGTFFLSDGMKFDRSSDGAHPTRKSAYEWMDSVIRWMPENHPHPIILEVPQAQKGKAKKIYIHQPNEL